MIYLIGTHHADRDGPKKLLEKLQVLKPSLITVEMSVTKAMGALLRRQGLGLDPNTDLTDDPRRSMSLFGYEYWASQHYALQNKTQVKCVQTEENEHILAIVWQEMFKGTRIQDSPQFHEYMTKTEDTIAEKIRRETRRPLVHIGGNEHIYGKHTNLYDRLKDLNPERISIVPEDLQTK